MKLKNGQTLPSGHTLNLQIRIARSDWGNMNFDDDYSAKGTDKLTVEQGGKVILGKEPK